MLAATDEELTVDQLAARAGVTVRTVRFYASRGLIPPPRLQGRTGLYGPEHLARLELIRELQALGFTLSAVEHHLEHLPDDASPEELALQRALLAPWTSELGEELDRAELDARADRELDDELLDQLGELGIVEPLDEQRQRFRLPSGALLDVGLKALQLGLPREMLRRAMGIVEEHTAQIAGELRELFAANVLRPYVERGRPDDEREHLRATTDQLRPLTIQVLVHGFQRAVNDVIRDHI